MVDFEAPVAGAELPLLDGVMIPSESHPLLDAPLMVLTYTNVEFDIISVTVVTGGITPLLAKPVDPDPLSVVTNWIVDVTLAAVVPVLEAAGGGRPVLSGTTVVTSEVYTTVAVAVIAVYQL
jgi:hypothetical protein